MTSGVISSVPIVFNEAAERAGQNAQKRKDARTSQAGKI